VAIAQLLLGFLLDHVLEISLFAIACRDQDSLDLAVVVLNGQPSLTNEKRPGLSGQVVDDDMLKEPASAT
jgi:hypothetical protein